MPLAPSIINFEVLIRWSPKTVNASQFYKLTPDRSGDYRSRTWQQIASPPTGYSPYATGEAVLNDGRVLLIGGEYETGASELVVVANGIASAPVSVTVRL